jgi:hypothetical protein
MSTVSIPEPGQPVTCEVFQNYLQQHLDNYHPYQAYVNLAPYYMDANTALDTVCDIICEFAAIA